MSRFLLVSGLGPEPGGSPACPRWRGILPDRGGARLDELLVDAHRTEVVDEDHRPLGRASQHVVHQRGLASTEVATEHGDRDGRVASHRRTAQEHLRCPVYQILTTDHVGDPAVGVIDGVCDDEHGSAVPAAQHEVLEVAVFEGDVAAYQVVPFGNPAIGNSEANHVGHLSAHSPVTTVSVVSALEAGGSVALLDLVLRAVAAVCRAGGEELLDHLTVALRGLALIGGLAIPIDAQPAERVEDDLDQLRLGTLAVGVFA